MNTTTNNNHKENAIIHIHSDNCEKCHKTIEIPISKSDKDSTKGGIFRIAVLHQCDNKKVVYLFYFDEFFVLRQKVSVEITHSELRDEDYLDRTKLPDYKKFAGFKFLFKKLGEDISKAIFAVIIGQQIVIIGDQTEVIPSCSALSAFSDFRACLIDEWTQTKSDADIVGTSPEFESVYSNAVIINLANKRIKYGTRNSLCLAMTNKLALTNNKEKFYEVISNEMSYLLNLCQEFSIVKSVQEAEDFIQALALEGIEKDLLDILLPLTAQINPNAGIFYRKYLDLIKIDSLDVLEPIYLWIYDNNFEKNNKIEFSQKDVPLNFREFNFTSRLSTIAKIRNDREEIFEFITPIHYFVTLFSKENNLTFCFPRMSITREQFASALNICNMLFNQSKTDDIFNIYLVDLVEEELMGILNGEKISLGNFDYYNKVKQSLASSHDFFILERHYFGREIVINDLKIFTEKLTQDINALNNSLDPKIIHQQDHFTITEIISNIPIFGTSKAETIDISFNIHIIINNVRTKKQTVDIVLEFCSKQLFFQFGIELNNILLKLYIQFSKLIEKAIKEC